MTQPRQNALEEYFKWEHETKSWVEVAADLESNGKAHFIPLENIRSYLSANNNRELNKILCDVFATFIPVIDAELILRDHTAIFCILLSIGQAKSIEYFVRYEELSDRRLPFDPSHPPPQFPNVEVDPTLLQRFCEIQMRYCVPVFDSHMLHKHFGDRRLLPITAKEKLETEGLASKYIVQIYGPYNKMCKPENTNNHNTKKYENIFILKSYPATKDHQYIEEVNGLRSVRHADSIIRFYGSYIYSGKANLLVEFADKGTLEEYFRTVNPPSRGLDIIRFWESLFQLIKGLKAVHSMKDGHHNVCPESICVLSNGAESASEWQFKWADVGSSQAGSVDDEHGNRSYASPEYFSGRRSIKFTAASDIWSLGCVYSEAAVWIADGYKGIQDYRIQRRARARGTLTKWGDCFHNGERLLPVVLDVHLDIEERLRRSDFITKDVLESMVDEMLWDEDRPNAKALLRKSEIVLARARQKLAVYLEESSSLISGQSRTVKPSRVPPPNSALPPIPPQSVERKLYLQLSSTCQRYSQSVDNWRTQIPGEPLVQSDLLRGVSDNPSLSSHKHMGSMESTTPTEREVYTPADSWRQSDTFLPGSPETTITSPTSSIRQHTPNDGRARGALQTLPSQIESRKPSPLSHGTQENRSQSRQDQISRSSSSVDKLRIITTTDASSMIDRNNTSFLDLSPHDSPDSWATPPPPPRLPTVQIPDHVPFQLTPRPGPGDVPYDISDSTPCLLPASRPLTVQVPGRVPTDATSHPVTAYSPGHNPESIPSSITTANSATNPQTSMLKSNHSHSNSDSTSLTYSIPYNSTSSQAPPIHSLTSSTIARTFDALPPPPTSHRRSGLMRNLNLHFPSKSITGNFAARLESKRNSLASISVSSLYSNPRSQAEYVATRMEQQMCHTRHEDLTGKREFAEQERSNSNVGESGFLSTEKVLSWKRVHKINKHPLLSTTKASLPLSSNSRILTTTPLSPLRTRDHVFIIDDSTSMIPHWGEVCKLFEGLSYLTKSAGGTSGVGLELFFAQGYETWRRRDTRELVRHVKERKRMRESEVEDVTARTKGAWRLALQLEAVRMRFRGGWGRNKASEMMKTGGPAAVGRPITFYFFTDGNWSEGSEEELKRAIRDTVLVLRGSNGGAGERELEGWVRICLVLFGEDMQGSQRVKQMVGEVEGFSREVHVACEKADGDIRGILGLVPKSPSTGGWKKWEQVESVTERVELA